MKQNNLQAPSAVVMIRPHHYDSNPETVKDNSFQVSTKGYNKEDLARLAYDESTELATCLRNEGVRVHVFEDKSRDTPDSVFPNNWFSTHSSGQLVIYPMFAPSRRKERRSDVVDTLTSLYQVKGVIDYSEFEEKGLFLEGTGAMVLDHIERVAYAVESKRADRRLFERFCTRLNFEPMMFEACDDNNVPVYHTNVLMCIGTQFVLIAANMIRNESQRVAVLNKLEQSGRTLIALTSHQIENFAGNAIELTGLNAQILALSARAMSVLTPAQRAIIEQTSSLLPLEVPTIELSGGSVRCMLAGIHLRQR